jgi:uncharacterized protein YecT (DUF1311 family)
MMIAMSHRRARSVVALAALLVAAGSLAAYAQQANPADLKAINACLAKADHTGDLGTACIGTIADPCTRKTEGDAAKTKVCAERELAVWDAITAAASKRVRAGGFKDISKALADSQKSWAQQRDALCPVFDKIEPGTLPGGAAYCRMQTTAQRALLLRRLGEAVNEH